MNTTTKKNLALAGVLVVLLAGAGYRFHVMRSTSAATTGDPSAICEHTITRGDCPFCTPSLLETKGFCAGHGVPEAICTSCHKDVIPAFKAKGDWCAEHDKPESQCVTCNPQVANTWTPPQTDGGHGEGEGAFCREHGVPESICFICSPALIEKGGTCAEHGVPEALCTHCNAALIPAFQKTFDWCAEHSVPESQCLACNPKLALRAAAAPPAPVPTAPAERLRAEPRVGCSTHTQRLELASTEVVRQAGLATTRVTRAPFRDLIEVNAEVMYRADRHAQLSSRVAGMVGEVRADLGQWVEEAAVVALIESPDLGEARADLASAVTLLELWERNHAREVDLASRGVGTQRAVIEADTRRTEVLVDLRRAEQRLRSLGLSAEQVDEARREGAVDSRVAVRAPFAGMIVARDAVQGEVVDAGEPLVTLVDTRTLWALLDVPENAIARLGLGQSIVLTVHSLRGEHFAGHITWIASEIDRRTRTLKARAEIHNDDGRLRANSFGTAQVTLGDRRDAILVPTEAVQWEGCCNVVFVPDGDRAFRPRKVAIGGATDTHLEVLRGLDDGESVVATGAFLLKTELLKGSIGAGCCEGE